MQEKILYIIAKLIYAYLYYLTIDRDYLPIYLGVAKVDLEDIRKGLGLR